MANRILRDHSEPCKDLGRFKEANGVWGCDEYGCPGGQEVTAEPMYRQGGMSGAWYPMQPDDEDEPDGYLISRDV